MPSTAWPIGFESRPLRSIISGILELAEATGLTAYDASYLWVAHSMGAELVTLDRKLAAAAT